ncbi:MAG: hydroxyacid dehydrogenase [Thermaerobacter sp.]|nr:hydroxyacid dehydrogenase [Thermaerobacter sp.]
MVSEIMDRAGLDRLRQAAEVRYDPKAWESADILSEQIVAADALVVRNQTRVTASLIQRAAALKVVGRLGVGLDNIDLDAVRARHIPLVVARGANATAVAEYVLTCLLHFTRDLTGVGETVRQGRWDRTLGGKELHGKVLGLLGLGDIAQRVAWRAKSFGMTILAYDPWQLPTQLAVADLGVTLTTLPQLLATADFVSVHLPLTETTRHLLNRQTLAQMKTGSYLINTARGGVIDETALLASIETEKIAGAALDVREMEPPSPSDPLCHHPRILLTPHIAGLSSEANVRTAEMVADDVLRVLRGQAPLASVCG